jgi:N-acetylneuraminic acid mutarotase
MGSGMVVEMLTAPAEAPTDPAAATAAYFDTAEARVQAFKAQFPKEIGAWTKRKSKKIGPYALTHLDVEIIRSRGAFAPLKRYEQHWLYFPPDFGSRHEFFVFLIANEYDAGGFMEPWGGGVGEIQDVIRSFQDKRPAAVSRVTPLINSQGLAAAGGQVRTMRIFPAAWSSIPSRPATYTVEAISGWTTKAPMRNARGALGVGVVGGILYAVGGSSTDKVVGTVEAYDPTSDKWSKRAPMPTPRSGLAVGVINGVLYAVGGQAKSQVVGTLEAYDPATNSWTTKAPMRNARGGLGVGVVGGILYAVGGTKGEDVFETVEAYDPATNTWRARAPLPTARMGVAVDIVNSVLYAVGGADEEHRGLGTVEAYDPVTDSWTTKAPMPTARFAPGVGVVNGVLYAVGGYDRPLRFFDNVEAYDPATNSWSTSEPVPQARVLTGVGVVDGVLYAVGGLDFHQEAVATVEAFVP